MFVLFLANKTYVLFQLDCLSVVEFHVEDGPSAHSSLGHPLLFGAASYHGADVALKLLKTSDKMEDCFDLILFINHLNKMR